MPGFFESLGALDIRKFQPKTLLERDNANAGDTVCFGPSEEFRAPMDYFAHSPETTRILERIARERPATLACMHGSAFRGDGAALLRALAERLAEGQAVHA